MSDFYPSRLVHLLEKLAIRRDRFLFYSNGLLAHTLQKRSKAASLHEMLRAAQARPDFQQLMERVDYCNRLHRRFSPSPTAATSTDFDHRAPGSSLAQERPARGSAYFLDFVSLMDYFGDGRRFDYVFGDNITVPAWPAFVKSRPLVDNNENSVLLKLNSLRHFYFVEDSLPFSDKIGQAIFRGACHRQPRKGFIETCHALPDTNIGDIRESEIGKPSYKAPISIREHLRYKYVISVEGNDVATNLKWIMSSNSLCFMIRPRFETWFMEGRLQPDHHYVLLRDDYSDLNEKINYYNENPQEARRIIVNAQRWVAQFKDPVRERLVGLLVIRKYLALSGQINEPV